MPIPRKEVREAVESIRSLSPRLNALTDLANETVRDVERFLNEECSIGVSAYVQIDRADSDPDGPREFLEYRRVGPRFRIAVVAADEDGSDLAVKPWADCPRAGKLESFKKLPELLTEIAEKVEAQIREAERAAKAVASTLAALRKSDESDDR